VLNGLIESVVPPNPPRLRLGVAARATLSILALVCAALVGCSTYIYVSQSAALRVDVNTNMSNLSATAARSVGNWLRGRLNLSQLMAQGVAVVGAGPAADGVLGAPIARETFLLSSFGRTDGFYTKMPKGPIPVGYDPRQRPWFKGAVAANGPILTEPYLAASTRQLTITASAPVLDETATFIGVVGNDFDLGALTRMINEVDTGGHGYAYLVSGAGKLLIHPQADLIGKSLSDLLAGALPKMGGAPTETRENGRPTLTVFARVPHLPPSLDWYVALSVDQASAFAPVERLATIMVAATLIVLLVLAVVVSRLMALTVARPLDRLVGVLQRMARGEIDAQITEARRSDEIGAVGRAVEGIKLMVTQKALEQAETKRIADAAAAVERQRTMIALADGFEQAVGGIVTMVSSSATELQATARTMTATATQTAAQSASVAAAAEKAASNVDTVAAAAEELGASVHEIARRVADSASLAQSAVAEADQTADLVKDLSEAVAKIGDVVGLISTIAGQTNLLALNATIEAARAGEAGRGFAVVATEVKALASQSAKATEEITGHIHRIQGSTDQAVSAIGGIAGRIREINTVAASIAAAVEEQGSATTEIVRNVAQAATGTGEVTGNITGVAAAAEETGEAASHVLASASELSRQSEHLTAEVRHFLDTVRAA
jgi:methyl-accepting chemotaxis protein